MRAELLFLAMTAALVGCTGDPVDTGDTDTGEDTADTDTGDTDTDTGDTDTDTGTVDTDTDTGTVDTDTGPVEPFCGDGNVDDGEQCDDADANGADGSCSDECKWNAWTTCDLLTGPMFTLDTTDPQPNGTYHIAGTFDGLVPVESSCVTDATHNAIVQFTLPTTGDWVLSTANALTSSHTAVSLRTDCDDRAEIQCGVDNAPVAGAAQAVVLDGQAGASYVALIELVDGEPDGWHLSLSPVDGVANAGEECDLDTPCTDSICTDGTCVTTGAPTIDDVSIVQVEYYSYEVTVTGSDPNHDAIWAFIPTFTDIYGDVWGDDAFEAEIPTPATFTWDGDDFTATWVQSIAFHETGLADVVDFDVQVWDRTGAGSNVLGASYPVAQTNQVMSYEGDACDMSSFPRYCDPNPHPDPADGSVTIPGLACTWDETATTSTCEDKGYNEAPIVDSVVMSWQGPTPWLTATGFDTREGNGVIANITAVYTDATTVNLPDAFLSSPITWDHGDFVGSQKFVITALTKPVDHLLVTIEDNGFPSASAPAVEVPWVAYVGPTVAHEGDACDLLGWEKTCEEPWVCTPTLSGIPECGDSVAPELISASATYAGGFQPQLTVNFEAFDENTDWKGLQMEDPRFMPFVRVNSTADLPWSTDPSGLQAYEGSATVGFAYWMYRVSVVDNDGNVSNSKIVSGVPTLNAGDACNTGACNFMGCQAPTAYCDIEDGQTCSNRPDLAGTIKVCETNVAPTLGDVIVRRIDSKKYEVTVNGTDANGDAIKAVVRVNDGVSIVTQSPTIPAATPLFGVTSFTSKFTGTLTNPYNPTTLEITVWDYGFLGSNTVTVTVPPILDPGDECTGDTSIGTCWEGSECQSGHCFAFEPSLTGATLTWKNNGRDAEVTITGQDDKTGTAHQLKTATVTLAGKTFTKTLSTTTPTWVGNTFTIKVDALAVGTGDLVGETFVAAKIVDIGGFYDEASYFLTPKYKDLDESCDANNVCHAGLVCDAASFCDNSPTDACAGIPVTVAASNVVDYNIAATGTGLENYSGYATCGSTSSQPNGKEVAIQYTATQDGHLRIKSAYTDANQHPGYLFVRFDECTDYATQVDCSNLTPNGTTILNNEVEVDVVTGDVLYVIVDGPSFKKGLGTVTFTYDAL